MTDLELGNDRRHLVGMVVQGRSVRHVLACRNQDSLWVEICGPKGGHPWEMAPSVARILAETLIAAADLVEEGA